MQVDATTLTLPRSRGDRARDIVRHGLADILAADNHGDERNVATALDWLGEHEGASAAPSFVHRGATLPARSARRRASSLIFWQRGSIATKRRATPRAVTCARRAARTASTPTA